MQDLATHFLSVFSMNEIRYFPKLNGGLIGKKVTI